MMRHANHVIQVGLGGVLTLKSGARRLIKLKNIDIYHVYNTQYVRVQKNTENKMYGIIINLTYYTITKLLGDGNHLN